MSSTCKWKMFCSSTETIHVGFPGDVYLGIFFIKLQKTSDLSIRGWDLP